MRKPLKILAICPFFLPKLHPEVIVNAKLFLGLLEHGNEVDVVTVRTHNDDGYTYSMAEEAWWAPLAPRIHRIEPSSHSRWGRFFCDLLGFATTGYHYRGVGDWSRELRGIDTLLHQKRYDCIMYRGPGGMGIPVLKAAKRHRLPLIVNLSDPWYNFPDPYPKEKNLRFKQFMAARILKHADAVTFPSRELADYSRRDYPVLTQKPCVIVPHALRDIVLPPTTTKEDSGVFTLTHAGSWGFFRNPLRLFKALKRVADRNPDVRFRFDIIGRANPEFDRMIAECGIGDIVHYLGVKSYEETLSALKHSSVSVLLEAECEVGIFMPSKFVDYLQARRPILAVSPASGCIADNISRFKVGESADVRSEEEIAAALQRLTDRFRAGTLADYDFSAAVRFFTNEPIQRTEELIAQLAGDTVQKQPERKSI